MAVDNDVKRSSLPVLVPQGHHAANPAIKLNRPVYIIGGKPNCRIRLISSTVSNAHAMLVQTRHLTYIRDLASRTHLFVNNKQVKEAILSDGDTITIGRFTFQYQGPARDHGAEPAGLPAALEVSGAELPVPIEERVILIGRRPNCDVPLLEESVSTQHAVIFQWEGQRFIRDLWSRTGTFVNGETIHEEQLKPGDLIRIGETELRYQPSTSISTDEANFQVVEGASDSFVAASPAAEEVPHGVTVEVSQPVAKTPVTAASIAAAIIAKRPITPSPMPLPPAAPPVRPVEAPQFLLEPVAAEEIAEPIAEALPVERASGPLSIPAEETPKLPAVEEFAAPLPVETEDETPFVVEEALGLVPAAKLAEPPVDPVAEAAPVERVANIAEAMDEPLSLLADEALELAPAEDFAEPLPLESSPVEPEIESLAVEPIAEAKPVEAPAFAVEEALGLLPVEETVEPQVVEPVADFAEAAPVELPPPVIDEGLELVSAEEPAEEAIEPLQSEPQIEPVDSPTTIEPPSLSVKPVAEVAPIEPIESQMAADQPTSLPIMEAIEAPTPAMEDVVQDTSEETVEDLVPLSEEDEVEPTVMSLHDTAHVPLSLEEPKEEPAGKLATEELQQELEPEPIAAAPEPIEGIATEELAAALPVEEVAVEETPLELPPLELVQEAHAAGVEEEPPVVVAEASLDMSMAEAVTRVESEQAVASGIESVVADEPPSWAVESQEETPVAEPVAERPMVVETEEPASAAKSDDVTVDISGVRFSDQSVEATNFDIDEALGLSDDSSTQTVSQSSTENLSATTDASSIPSEPPAEDFEPILLAPESEPLLLEPEIEAEPEPTNAEQESHAEVIEPTDPSLESALNLRLIEDPPPSADAQLTDTTFARSVEEFEGESLGPIVEAPAELQFEQPKLVESDTPEEELTVEDATDDFGDLPLELLLPPDEVEVPQQLTAEPAMAEEPVVVDAVDDSELPLELLLPPEAEVEPQQTSQNTARQETSVVNDADDAAETSTEPLLSPAEVEILREPAIESTSPEEIPATDEAAIPLELELPSIEIDIPHEVAADSAAAEDACAGIETENPAELLPIPEIEVEQKLFAEPVAEEIAPVDEVESSTELLSAPIEVEIDQHRLMESAAPEEATVSDELIAPLSLLPPPQESSATMDHSADPSAQLNLPPEPTESAVDSTPDSASDSTAEESAPVEPPAAQLATAIDQSALLHENAESTESAAEISPEETPAEIEPTAAEPLHLELEEERETTLNSSAFGRIEPPPAESDEGSLISEPAPTASLDEDTLNFSGAVTTDASLTPSTDESLVSSSGSQADSFLRAATTAEPMAEAIAFDLLEHEQPLVESKAVPVVSPPSLSADEGLDILPPEVEDEVVPPEPIESKVTETPAEKPEPRSEPLIHDAFSQDAEFPKLHEIDIPPYVQSGSGPSPNILLSGLSLPPVRQADIFSELVRADSEPPEDSFSGATGGPTVYEEVARSATLIDVGAKSAAMPSIWPPPARPRAVPTGLPIPSARPALIATDQPLPEDAAIRRRKLLRRAPILMGLMVLLIAGAWAAIWFLIPLRSRISATLSYNNFTSLTQAEQRKFQADQLSRLSTDATRRTAVRMLENRYPGVQHGFLDNLDQYLTVVSNPETAWQDEKPGQFVIRYDGTDPAHDPARVEAVALALYDSNSALANNTHSLQQDLTRLSNQIKTSNARIDELKTQAEQARAVFDSRPTTEQIKRLQAADADFEATYNEEIRKSKDAQADVDRLKQDQDKQRVTETASADSATGDAEIVRMSKEAGDLDTKIAAARKERAEFAAKARETLDKAYDEFKKQVDAAQDATKDSPQLAAYVTAAQNLQQAIRELTDQYIQREQGEYTALNQLKDQIEAKMQAHKVDLLANDPKLKELNDQKEILTRKYNAAVGSGMDKEASDLQNDMKLNDSMLKAQQEIISNDPVYSTMVTGLQQMIDQKQHSIADERKRTDEKLASLKNSFSRSAPTVEALPAEQKQLASAMHDRLLTIDAARKQYAEAADASAADSDASVKKMVEDLRSLQTNIETRKKQIVAANSETARAAREKDRQAALAAKTAVLTDANKVLADARTAYEANHTSLLKANSAANEARASADRLDEANRERDRLVHQVEQSSLEWDQKNVAVEAAIEPVEPTQADIRVLGTVDPRPKLGLYASGGIFIIFAGWIMLTLLGAAREPQEMRAPSFETLETTALPKDDDADAEESEAAVA